ncbi:S9 family peptidase [Avrilella dinanensis]|uniref:S9 family peptidase n=1 Tax=Avrilella dinanensis TaxID=2008672 RepID=A0A2M9R6Q5_9FLAO|nr:S9 family peptidase [Avrilella dinanensis]PJR04561.1 S9 family peptidase [Avrilella dinanensis]
MKKITILCLSVVGLSVQAQTQVMTPETLWKLGRVSPIKVSDNNKMLYYSVTTPNVAEDDFRTDYYQIGLDGKGLKEIDKDNPALKQEKSTADGKYTLSHEAVKVKKVLGADYYENLDKSDVYVYDGLDYRHWDTWNDGTYSHVILTDNQSQKKVDLLEGEPYYSPQKPFGGSSDYIFSPDGKKVIYVAKKVEGTAYALSTNTDLYEYDIKTGKTINLTENNKGYDTYPSFSPNGHLTWLQMKRDGYEADKNDIIVRYNGSDMNLTAQWNGTVNSYVWSEDGKKVYFTAPVNGTTQLFEVNFPAMTQVAITVKQLTEGDFDVTGIVKIFEDKAVLTRTDYNTATEVYQYHFGKKDWKKITSVNDEMYAKITKSKVEKRFVETTDGKQMLTWIIYPPNFDPNKKYPTLLYCQGGPQSPVSQFYSFRWNFQVMAAQGYIIVAPNRRGLPGFGVEWNEAISKDWAGQPMRDYLSAIDDISKEKYVDSNRLGAVGASYGGYSVYYLAGIHEKRFKTFIAHCGVFNLESMYGTTEEVFFPNWDTGGAYWDTDNEDAQRAYNEFNPINNVSKWDTPMLVIHGGKDYRVPIGQGQEAFQAAQLQGIKSRFVYIPEENHWVLSPQNALVWQGEFFRWLKETL